MSLVSCHFIIAMTVIINSTQQFDISPLPKSDIILFLRASSLSVPLCTFNCDRVFCFGQPEISYATEPTTNSLFLHLSKSLVV